MNELDLFDELTYLDDDLILEAHQIPDRKVIRFPRLRKASVLIAAVMLLVVTVGAIDWNYSASWLAERFNDQNTGHIWITDGAWHLVEDGSWYIDSQEFCYVHSQVFTQEELQYYVVCDGVPLKATLEAMILMEDGRMEYKQVESTNTDRISLLLDNYVGDEAGMIITVRNRLLYEFDDGWDIVHERYCFLPSQLGLQVPYGIDPRFPDMQYNYDGRGE